LLSDVVMPDIDGFTLVRQVRADAGLARLPVVLMTAHREPGHVIQALVAGADNYVVKPFENDVLLERVRRTIAGATSGVVSVLQSALEDAARQAEALEASRRSLAAAVSQRDELLAVVAHDLRAPLQILLGHAHLAQRDPATHAERLAAVVASQVSAMVALIDDLVDLSQIESGTLRIETRPIDLVEVVRECVDANRIGQARRHELTFSAPDQLPIHADPRRITQIVSNLLGNACKYSDPGSPVRVEVDVTSRGARVTVSDEGIGIDPEALATIFDRYGRTEEGRRRAEGSGLGLYICRRLAELHGGQLTVTSVPGEGSTFALELPSPR
jgi:signal transduction histidine kinase